MAGHHRKRPREGFDNRRARDESPRIRVLWVTPLHALSADIHEALLRAVEDLDLPCRWNPVPTTRPHPCETGKKNASPPP
ncbi:MAG: hypothetical protein WBV91_19315 [Desulfobacterales bacterium]